MKITSDLLVLAPVLWPFACSILALLLEPRRARFLGWMGPLGILAFGLLLLVRVRDEGILVSQLGDWPAPIGISFLADQLAAIMVILTGFVALATSHFAHTEINGDDLERGRIPLLNALLMGVCGAFLTSDLFNLYVWFEVLLLSSFALMSRTGSREELAGNLRYLVLSLLSSFFFLVAIGLVYATTGTLNMVDISRALLETGETRQGTWIATLLLIAFGIKAGLFPFFAWLPAAYRVAAPALAALFAGLLTKVGVYAILRTMTLIVPPQAMEAGFIMPVLIGAAALTMLSGVLGAASQMNVRGILSFHISSQIGYMIMGIALLTPLAVAGTVFYLIHHILTKTALFLVSAIMRRRQGSEELAQLGGLMTSTPWLAIGFLIPALSLAGIPPFSGFWAKLTLMRAGVEVESWLLVGVAAVTGLWTVFSMTKIWANAFWGESPAAEGGTGTAASPTTPKLGHVPMSMGLPLGTLALASVVIGVAAGPVFELSNDAATQLMDRVSYENAVFGAPPMGLVGEPR